MRAWVLFVIAGCSSTPFGRIVTEVTVSPTDPKLLLVRSCELVQKSGVEQVGIGDCKRTGVRRSAIVPVPVADARVPFRPDRVVTGFVERTGGGAVVTTCRIGKANDRWKLLDCADTELATAALEVTP